MKWSMMIRENVLQMNLEPENDHEREAMKILAAHGGKATIHPGVDINQSMGGYLRNYGESSKSLAITITKEPTP